MDKVYIVVEDLFWNGDENHEVKGAFRKLEDAKQLVKAEKEKFIETHEIKTDSGDFNIKDTEEWFGCEDKFTGDNYDVSIVTEELQ